MTDDLVDANGREVIAFTGKVQNLQRVAELTQSIIEMDNLSKTAEQSIRKLEDVTHAIGTLEPGKPIPAEFTRSLDDLRAFWHERGVVLHVCSFLRTRAPEVWRCPPTPVGEMPVV